ncbi:MAG: peptide chain release factor 3 [Alphaproteobacteria bacterium]|nr:peptide chain release factor 3 [Alphaproteobacteria bacterium]
MSHLSEITSKRRTFAIISHPDAGKTTLTEKLLLFGGAINQAGAVKARGDSRRARSDWMKVEQERGISVASSVMTFDYGGCTFNLLDTPGHEDFSEDTYRVLTAVDSAVMVIDCAKGIETQTKKLFEVCRLRDIPIMTFINKMDRDGQDAFKLMAEIEQTLALDATPAVWPIGQGRDFRGCFDLMKDRLILMARGDKSTLPAHETHIRGIADPQLDALLPAEQVAQLRAEVELVRGACPPFVRSSYLDGHMTPVFFGSAIHNFGIRELLDALVALAPSPRPQTAAERAVRPDEDKVSGFVFKIQANMDPKHRDRIAFVRLCSGHFKRGMKLLHARSGKMQMLHNPILFLGQDRAVAEEAFAGDIVGLPNHGGYRIGDGFSEGESLTFRGIPSFAPELLQKVRATDPLKAKHLGRALEQIAEESGASIFKPVVGSDWIVGVIGGLQFEVLADRIRTEFDVPVAFEPTSYLTARWIAGSDADVRRFCDANRGCLATDHDGEPVYLARNAWHLGKVQEDYPALSFLAVKN